MANLRRVSSLRFFFFFVFFFAAVIIIAHAETVRADGHHDKSDREKESSMASASHPRPSHLDRSSKRLHHQRSELSSHHRGRASRKGRRSSAIHHKKTSPRRSRHSYVNPLWERLLRHALHQSSKGGHLFFDHYRSPAFNSFHKYYRDQVNLMEKLRSQLVNQVGHLRGRMNYYQHGSRHVQPSRSSHHTRGHRRHPYHRSHQEVTGRRTGHHGGKRQYKIVRNNVVPVKDVPEDVEVFGRPTVVRTHVRPTRPSFTPTVWTTSVPGTDPKNCTKTDREPFHHTEIKSTSISHSRNNFSPVHSVISSHAVFSGGKYHGSEEKGPHSVGEVLGVGFPTYSNVFSHPVTRIHDSMLPSGAVIPSVKNHLGSVRVSIGSTGRSQKPSIEEHLNKLPSAKGDRRGGEELPCIKCPPDTRVEAPRGSDCVIAYPPSPLSCTPRFIPELRTVVTEGPAPGSLLPEGRYRMIIAVWTSDSSTSTPVTTCNVSYDVEVRKCPALPEVEGAEVTCTAGRAWGSKCSWVCRGGRVLQGSSVTTCTGHSRPRWTHQPPRCNEPTSEKPEIPPPPSTPLHPARPPSPPIGSCPQPADVPGGRLICEPPSIEILPRRDLIPKDEPAPSTPTEDDAPSDGVIRPRSVSSPLELYPVGTSCKVECDPGMVLRQSEMDRVFLTCSPALIWNRSPSGCYSTEPPVPRDNDCDDVTLSLDQISSLPLPVFFNVNGDRADVTCDMQEIKRSQHFVRKCKAIDQDLQTSATCQYVITVRPTVEFPSEKPDEGTAGGSAKNPKNTEYETVADVFRRKGKKHKSNGDRKLKPDKISFVPTYQRGDLSGEDFNDHYDVFNQGDADHKPGDRLGDDRGSHVLRPETVLHQTERVPHGIAEERVYEKGALATSISPVVSQASATPGEDSKRSFHSHSAQVPKPDSAPGISGEASYNRLHSLSDVESSKIAGEREVIPQVSKTKRGRDRSESKHAFEVTRREKADETETAVMEAAIELNILVDDCRNADQVKKALYELLLMLESCKKLACHTPKTKCRQRPDQEESVVKVTWIVGGLFEPLEDYYYDDVQVPVVETDIDSLMISAERLIASERTTRAMEVLGAAIDLTSFSLNRLDLVCKNKAYRFDAQTNRCIQDEQQEL